MTTITICSQKGGVGKTTVAINLAFALARREWRTLLVDLDHQGSIALSLSQKARSAPGFFQCAFEEQPVADTLIRTRIETLAILPAGQSPPLHTAHLAHQLEDGQPVARILEQAREIEFDVVVCDTPSGFSGSTIGAMRAADFLLAIEQAEPLAVRSVERLIAAFRELQEDGAADRSAGILLTMLDARQPESLRIAHEISQALPHDLLFDVAIPRDPIFVEASGRGLPVALMHRNPSVAAIVFDQLAAEIELRLGYSSKPHDTPVATLVD